MIHLINRQMLDDETISSTNLQRNLIFFFIMIFFLTFKTCRYFLHESSFLFYAHCLRRRRVFVMTIKHLLFQYNLISIENLFQKIVLFMTIDKLFCTRLIITSIFFIVREDSRFDKRTLNNNCS